MLFPRPNRTGDRSDDQPEQRADIWRAAARRWRYVGLVGSTLTAIAATGVGDLPTTDELGGWPSIFGDHPRGWPGMILAYLGLTLVAGAWWQLGSAVRALPDRLAFVIRTAALWALPLAVAPPLYSRDVYSYLAQGALYTQGLDPYRVGPAALGGALASNVSAIWQDTPAPYGPVFLVVASAVTALTGHHIVLAVLAMRAVMIGSLAATAAFLVPLARRFGVDPATAVWFGVLNPLALAHVVSGAHNDALMIMLMIGGVLLAVRDRPIAAAVVLGLAVLVKLPAAAALVVVIPAMARRFRGRYRMPRGALLVGAVSALTMLAVTLLMGTWYGWVSALSDTARVRNGLSISTNLGVVVDALAWLVGQDTGSIDPVSVFRSVGVVVAGALALVVLIRMRGRPLYALALIMFAVVLLGPVVHPWYLLWGLVPLAVSTRDTVLLGRVALLIVGLALYPMPWGEGFSRGVAWGVLGVAIGVLVLQAVRLADPSPAARAARLQVQAR